MIDKKLPNVLVDEWNATFEAKFGFKPTWLFRAPPGVGPFAVWAPRKNTWGIVEDFPHGEYALIREAPGVTYKWDPEMVQAGIMWISKFSLIQMPGCCGIGVAYHAASYTHGKGWGGLLNRMRLEMLRSMGYTIALCTDKVSNSWNRKILSRNGWQDLLGFTNLRTGNRVNLSIVKLTE